MPRDFIIPSVETYDVSYYNQQDPLIYNNIIPPNSFNGPVYNFHIDGSNIYFAGNFTSPHRFVTKWNGSSFEDLNTQQLPTTYNGSPEFADAVATMPDGVYLGMCYNGVLKYNGSSWESIRANDRCFAMHPSAEGLYLGLGWGTNVGFNILNGNTLTKLGGTTPTYDIISGSDGVYVASEFGQALKWNGSTITDISFGGYGNNEVVCSASNGVYFGTSLGAVSKYNGVNQTIILTNNGMTMGMFVEEDYLYVFSNKLLRYHLPTDTWEASPVFTLNSFAYAAEKVDGVGLIGGTFTDGSYSYVRTFSFKRLFRNFYPFTMLNKPVFLQRRIPYYTYKGE